MPTYKLTYFNARGRAEITRLMFAAAGIEYENVTIDPQDWPELKKKTLLGQLPILEIDGTPYCQSVAFHRYLAKQLGFAGNDDLENLKCDVVVDTCNDFRIPHISGVAIARFITKNVDAEEEAKKRLQNEGLPKFLPIFEKFLTEYGDSGYFVGSHLTWADFAVFEILETPLSFFPDILKKYPKLEKHHKMVESNPGVKAWLAKRPVTLV